LRAQKASLEKAQVKDQAPKVQEVQKALTEQRLLTRQSAAESESLKDRLSVAEDNRKQLLDTL